jgi:hypothetical protein
VPGTEPPEPLRVAEVSPARAVGSAWPGARLAARVCSCAAASWPIRLGEVHRGAVEVVEPSAGSAASGTFGVQVAVGAAAVAGVAATLPRDASPAPAAELTEPALDPTGACPTHSPLPVGWFTAATLPTPGAVREGTIGATIGASGAAIGAMT